MSTESQPTPDVPVSSNRELAADELSAISGGLMRSDSAGGDAGDGSGGTASIGGTPTTVGNRGDSQETMDALQKTLEAYSNTWSAINQGGQVK